MKKQRLFIVVLFLGIAAFLIFQSKNLLVAENQFSDGKIVWAQWEINSWYHGKIAFACEGGYQINFDDGDQKCCAVYEIAIDEIPLIESVVEGSKVLALWTDGKYYPGKVNSINGSDYKIDYDDGDQLTVNIEKIRLIGK